MSKSRISGIELIKNNSKKDERGYLSRLYDTTQDQFFVWNSSFNSIAVLNKQTHTLRGMHYQVNEFAETKIAFCLTGKIFDAVIDLRVTSETYLQSGINLPEFSTNPYKLNTRKCVNLFAYSSSRYCAT